MIQEEKKYGWNHSQNGVWHPVGEWISWPEADAEEPGPFGDSKYDEYNRERVRYLQVEESYNKLVEYWTPNPARWFQVFSEIRFEPGACFATGADFFHRIQFRTDFTEADLASCYCFPPGQRVRQALYDGVCKDLIHGLKPAHWAWRVRFDLVDNILVATEFRAISSLLDNICSDSDYEKKKAVSAAIAKEARNGVYIAQSKTARRFPKKAGIGEWLIISYEILNKQARSVQGALFFDEKSSQDVRRLQQLEKAAGVTVRDLLLGKKGYFKAHFDFDEKYPRLEDPRRVAQEEVQEWL